MRRMKMPDGFIRSKMKAAKVPKEDMDTFFQ
jgi:hypothetical protein